MLGYLLFFLALYACLVTILPYRTQHQQDHDDQGQAQQAVTDIIPTQHHHHEERHQA